jgi:hypothetical protein
VIIYSSALDFKTARALWLGWAYLTNKMPHTATAPIATAFKICMSHRKNGLLNRLPAAGES